MDSKEYITQVEDHVKELEETLRQNDKELEDLKEAFELEKEIADKFRYMVVRVTTNTKDYLNSVPEGPTDDKRLLEMVGVLYQFWIETRATYSWREEYKEEIPQRYESALKEIDQCFLRTQNRVVKYYRPGTSKSSDLDEGA